MTSTKPTLLLVDDEKNSREGLARALQRQYNVLLAENGPRALELLNANKIDIVIRSMRFFMGCSPLFRENLRALSLFYLYVLQYFVFLSLWPQ